MVGFQKARRGLSQCKADESGGMETGGSGKYPALSHLAVAGTSKGPGSQVVALWENQALTHRTELFPS